MRIAVVGLGSMGQRRIRLLKSRFDVSSEDIVGIDLDEKKRSQAAQEYSIFTSDDMEGLLASQDIDAVFVCTGPASHGKIINTCLKNALHVFSEINLVDTLYEENIELAEQQGKVLFLSSTGMYRPEAAYIREAASRHEIGAYCYHIGQYLPDWHPWEDYRDMFLAHPETNACREILAVELPWLVAAFGKIVSQRSLHHRSSMLDIDYDDTFSILLEHESGITGTLTVDVVSRKAVRNFECFGEGGHIVWDGSPTGFMSFDLDKKELMPIDLYGSSSAEQLSDYAAFVVEDAYANEIEEFFAVINEGKQARYSFEQDKKILDIVSEIGA